MKNVILRKRSPKGFTLVELLAVIAILVVLAGLILITISGVRKRAAATRCASNLRQLGVAARLFSNDNRGEVPYANYWSPTGTTWVTKIAPYVADAVSEKRGPVEDGAQPEDVFRCPACDLPIYQGSRSHYGKNYFINGQNGGPPPPARTIGYSFQNIDSPGKYYFMADSAPNAAGYAGREIGTGVTDSELFAVRGIQARHQGRANVLFMDIHVETIPLDRIATVVDYGSPPWCPKE